MQCCSLVFWQTFPIAYWWLGFQSCRFVYCAQSGGRGIKWNIIGDDCPVTYIEKEIIFNNVDNELILQLFPNMSNHRELL